MGLISEDFDVSIPIEYLMQAREVEKFRQSVRGISQLMPYGIICEQITLGFNVWFLPELYFGVHNFKAENILVRIQPQSADEDYLFSLFQDQLLQYVADNPGIVGITVGDVRPDLTLVQDIWDPRPGWEGIKHHTPFLIHRIKTPNDFKRHIIDT